MAGETEWWDQVEKGSSTEDSTLKKDLQNEELNNKRAMMRKWRDTVGAEQARAAAQEAAFDPSTRDKDGKMQRWWDRVNSDADHLINDNAAGWQEFPNFMTDLCHKALNIARANWYDPIDYTYFVPDFIQNKVSGIWVGVKDTIIEGIEDAYQRKFGNIELPNIVYSASLNDQGKLEVKVTKNGEPVTIKDKNGKPDMDDIGTKLQYAMDTGAVAWGKLQGPQGYDFNPDDQTFKSKADGSLMTNDQWKEYNAVPEKGLNAALNKRVDMVLKEEEAPATPAPGC